MTFGSTIILLGFADSDEIHTYAFAFIPMIVLLGLSGLLGFAMLKFTANQSKVCLLPVLIDFLLVVWTAVVFPLAHYGDGWAIYPALIPPLIVFSFHLYLLITQPKKLAFLGYALIRLPLFLIFWILCLMAISKDCI